MTLLDLTAVVAVLLAAAMAWWRPRLARPAAAMAAAIVALQAVAAARWQMVPAYVAAAVLLVVGVVRAGARDVPSRRGEKLVGLLAASFALVSLVAGTALPVLSLTEPVGVGTTSYTLLDGDRTHPSGPAGVPRALPVQVWYPTDATDGPRNPVTTQPAEFAAIAGDFLGLPSLLLRHLGLARTAAIVDAPLPTEPLPVVVSVHGWGGFRVAQVQLLEALAADGHLVIAMDHAYGALVSQPIDGGEVIGIDPDLLPDGVPDEEYDRASTELERLFRDDVLALIADLVDGGGPAGEGAPAEVVAAADLDRLVIQGHSTGGGAAIWACAELGVPACDGVIGHDPWVEPLPPEVRSAGLDVPLVSLRSDPWVGDDNDALLVEVHAATEPAVGLAIPGTLHRDVTVLPLLTPLASRIGLSGTLAPAETHRLTEAITSAALQLMLGSGSGRVELLTDPPDGVEVSEPR